jgi:hypothetical protein
MSQSTQEVIGEASGHLVKAYADLGRAMCRLEFAKDTATKDRVGKIMKEVGNMVNEINRKLSHTNG